MTNYAEKTDYKLLYKQKHDLLAALFEKRLTSEETVDGLLNFLDAVLDEAEENGLFEYPKCEKCGAVVGPDQTICDDCKEETEQSVGIKNMTCSTCGVIMCMGVDNCKILTPEAKKAGKVFGKLTVHSINATIPRLYLKKEVEEIIEKKCGVSVEVIFELHDDNSVTIELEGEEEALDKACEVFPLDNTFTMTEELLDILFNVEEGKRGRISLFTEDDDNFHILLPADLYNVIPAM